MRKNILKLFISYIYHRRKTYIFFALIFIAYYVILYLQNQDRSGVVYALFICSALGICIESVNFHRFYKKYTALNYIYEHSPYYDTSQLQRKGLDEVESTYITLLKDMDKTIRSERKRADRARKDVLDYYTTWIHQIKIPISVMNLMLDEEDNRKNYILKNELFKIEEYIHMVLGYLRLDKDASDFMIRKYNLDDIVRSAIRKYKNQFILKGIAIEYVSIDKQVVTDSKWLKLMIEQIISNSIKYTKEGKVKIYFENNALIVEDTGIGVTKEDIPRIFSKGYTGYNGRLEEKSTGMGLYLVKIIAEKLDIKIEFVSEKSVGSKVFMIFSENEVYENFE